MSPLLLVGAGLATAAAYAYTKLDAAKKLIYNLAGYSFKSGKLAANFQLTNPTKQQYVLTYIFLDMYAGSQVVAQARQEKLDATYIFPAEATTTKPVFFRPIGLAFGTALVKFLAGGLQPPPVRIQGYIKVNDLRLPVDYEVTYLPEKPAKVAKTATK